MGDLDDEELKETKKHYRTDIKIVIDKNTLEEIRNKYEECKKYVEYQEDWVYYDGIVKTLNAILEGDLSKI